MSKSSPLLSLYLREQNRLLQLIRTVRLPRHGLNRQQAEERQEQEQLLKRLRGLPRRNQQVFLLSRLDGLPYSSIAERLGVPLGTVEKDMIRALRHWPAA